MGATERWSILLERESVILPLTGIHGPWQEGPRSCSECISQEHPLDHRTFDWLLGLLAQHHFSDNKIHLFFFGELLLYYSQPHGQVRLMRPTTSSKMGKWLDLINDSKLRLPFTDWFMLSLWLKADQSEKILGLSVLYWEIGYALCLLV